MQHDTSSGVVYVTNSTSIGEIKKALSQAGVIVFKNFFTPSDFSSIWLEIRQLINAFEKKANISLEHHHNEEIDKDISALINQCKHLQPVFYDRLQQMLSLLSLPSSPKINSLAKHILDTDSIGVWPRVQMRMDLYNDYQNLIHWHNDYIYNKGTTKSFTFWFPVSTLLPQMGYLKFGKNSHLQHELKPISLETNQRHKLSLTPKDIETLDIIQPSVNLYDLVIFNSLTWHTGVINELSERCRLIALFRLQNINSLEL